MSKETSLPHEGGSYVISKDGKPVRQAFTLQPGEPGHGEEAGNGAGATGKPEEARTAPGSEAGAGSGRTGKRK